MTGVNESSLGSSRKLARGDIRVLIAQGEVLSSLYVSGTFVLSLF